MYNFAHNSYLWAFFIGVYTELVWDEPVRPSTLPMDCALPGWLNAEPTLNEDR